ncbi:hypothetical protein AMTRI_Chr13g117430 [Amborella trichopoda]
MVCVGSKTLKFRKTKSQSTEEMKERRNERKERKNVRNHWKEGFSKVKENPASLPSGKSSLSKRVDPETSKYFLEISSLLEGNVNDLEERSVLCGNALEETRGKELQIASDKILSHVLEILLQSCSVDQLCSFLLSCANDFPSIAIDQSGSHVAETAFKALALYIQYNNADSAIEQVLRKICQVVMGNTVDVMCSSYGSHVMRSLLCLLKGVPLDFLENFHVTKSAAVLAERLKSSSRKSDGEHLAQMQQSFPDLLKFLVRGMLSNASEHMETLRVHNFGTLVLQTVLKLLEGDDEELLHIIPILLGCNARDVTWEGEILSIVSSQAVLGLIKDPAFSHLMEVILEVAPDSLYSEIFTKVFRGSLFDLSWHQCSNFVVQALASSTRHQGQMSLLWEELGPKFKELLKLRKSGVVACLLAGCLRLNTLEKECCQALANAVCLESGSTSCIIPRIFFLENYFFEEKSNWNWPLGERLSTLGCLMLQIIFRLPREHTQQYTSSLTSMESIHVLETAKDAGGSRVIEAFLSSDASVKQKQKIVSKLKGHFGELAMHQSGCFTVEKCFSAVNVPLKEVICSDLLSLQNELSKTKHGPHLLRKCDVARYSNKPDQWRSAQASKETTKKEFLDLFSFETKSKNVSYKAAAPSGVKSPQGPKKKRKGDIMDSLIKDVEKSMAKVSGLGQKRHRSEDKDNKGASDSLEYSSDSTKKKRKERNTDGLSNSCRKRKVA